MTNKKNQPTADAPRNGKVWESWETTLALALLLNHDGPLTEEKAPCRELAAMIGRSPKSVYCKIENLRYLDSREERKCLSHGARTDTAVWNAFVGSAGRFDVPVEKLYDEVGRILTDRFDPSVQNAALRLLLGNEDGLRLMQDETEGTTLTRTRLRQGYFREVVLNRYHHRCLVTGLELDSLIEVAHIIPWSENEELRLVPDNALPLNPFVHRAYDLDLIGIDPDFHIHVSNELLGAASGNPRLGFLDRINGADLLVEPDGPRPSQDHLGQRYEGFLNRARHAY